MPNEKRRKLVAVWRTQLLPGSETFIREHTDAYRQYSPQLLGALRVESALSRDDDRIAYTRSLFDRAALFIAGATGITPRLTREFCRGYQVVHAHFLNDAMIVARSARRANVPLVVTCHGYDVTALPQQSGVRGRYYRWRARRVLSSATVICCSEFIAEQARKLGARDPRVIYNGYSGYAHDSDHGDTSTPGGEFTWDIVFIGRLVPKKGVEDLLTAVRAVDPDMTVAIVGDGPLRHDIEAHARGLHVDFLGARPPHGPGGVREILSQSRMFVGPSRTAANGDAEGFGQVFLEAAAARLPVVAYRHGGVAEAVVDGETGLLVDEGDVGALGAAIRRLRDDTDLATRLGTNGWARVRAEFTVTEAVRRVETTYTQAIRHHK